MTPDSQGQIPNTRSIPDSQGDDSDSRILSCPGVRQGLFLLGITCVALGLAGIVLPLLPSTIFFLIALWAFSRSSTRFHDWLFHHPRLGGPLRQWHSHRVIPMPAKVAALAMMAASLVFVTLFVAEDWVLPSALGALLGLVAAYIVTRPHRLSTQEI